MKSTELSETQRVRYETLKVLANNKTEITVFSPQSSASKKQLCFAIYSIFYGVGNDDVWLCPTDSYKNSLPLKLNLKLMNTQ